MNRSWALLAFVCLWSGLSFCGACVSPAPSPATHTVRHFGQNDPAQALAAAQSALVSLGYVIDELDESQGIIIARPAVPGTSEEAGSESGRLGGRRPVRRVAQVRVAQGEGGLKIYCKVLVQRQMTETYRMFERERGTSDVPSDTPIQREASTTSGQNTVWETVRRDTAAERLIAQTVLEHAGAPPT